jgi:hypothetical protein
MAIWEARLSRPGVGQGQEGVGSLQRAAAQ